MTINKIELEQLSYEDTLVELNSLFEQFGCREVMKDFREGYPAMFAELVIQINRLGGSQSQVAALLKP